MKLISADNSYMKLELLLTEIERNDIIRGIEARIREVINTKDANKHNCQHGHQTNMQDLYDIELERLKNIKNVLEESKNNAF